MPSAYDAVIVGAGLSGLSLAAHVADSAWSDRRVLVIDDGQHPMDLRAWSLWTKDPGWLDDAVSGAWHSIAVHAGDTGRTLPLDPYRYVEVRGDLLRGLADERIATAPRFETMTGTVEDIVDGPTGATVRVDGHEVAAQWAFDSRPPGPTADDPTMVFLGWEITTEADAFDPSVATFMDFRGRSRGRVRFCYALPATPRRALVEIAEFCWAGPVPDLSASLDDYLRSVCGLRSWTVTRSESGVLPLIQRPPADVRSHVVPIGTRGGMLKPSTGFALDRIQRHSAGIAASLVAHGHPHSVQRSRPRHPWLDAVLLDVLHRDPDLVETVFARLFARNSAPAIFRFLDEDSTMLQEARLVATLPIGPFARSALERPLPVGR